MVRPLCITSLLALTIGCVGGPQPPSPDPLPPLEDRSGLTGELIQIADFVQPCNTADGVEVCIPIRRPGEDAWSELPDRIDGFVPQWGVRSILDVEVTETEGVEGVDYTLVAVLEEEIVAPGGVFTMRLSAEYLVGGARLLDGREFECETWELCASLDERLAVGDRFDVSFEHPATTDEPLILVAIP